MFSLSIIVKRSPAKFSFLLTLFLFKINSVNHSSSTNEMRKWRIGPNETDRQSKRVDMKKREGRMSYELVTTGRGEGGGRVCSLKVELVMNRVVAKQPILFPLLRA